MVRIIKIFLKLSSIFLKFFYQCKICIFLLKSLQLQILYNQTMNIADSNNIIEHDLQNQRFTFTVALCTAYLSYQIVTDDIWDFQHTIVPGELSGQGIGSKLVKHALDYAQIHQKKIIASCSFVASFIDKHSEYKTLLA